MKTRWVQVTAISRIRFPAYERKDGSRSEPRYMEIVHSRTLKNPSGERLRRERDTARSWASREMNRLLGAAGKGANPALGRRVAKVMGFEQRYVNRKHRDFKKVDIRQEPDLREEDISKEWPDPS